jgi:hypothetical protein
MAFAKSQFERPNELRKRALGMTALALVIVFILWNVPLFNAALYPLRLFVTYVHEAGHSLMALLTGGEIRGFLVSANGSGLAVTAGGIRALIIPAGYLGAAAFGSILFYVVNRFPRLSETISLLLGASMIVFTLLFARPDETGAPLALILGVGFGFVLVYMGLRASEMFNLLVLNILAVITALNAVLDLYYLIRFIDASRGIVSNDAVAFSEQVMPILPPTLVAIIWAIMSLAMFGLAVWHGVLKPVRRGIDTAYSRL